MLAITAIRSGSLAPGDGSGRGGRLSVRLGRGVRAVLSAVCWVLAVASGILTGAAFAGGGLVCQAGRRTHCAPQTWLLVIGIALALGFGVLAASLYKPRSKPKPRRPWDYPP
jgi:hypothetical protein